MPRNSNSGAGAVLERLKQVKQTGPGRWLACCPAHKDKSPSLSIRELDDGRVLLHDFGGCDTGAVLDAIGLQMADLFPSRLEGDLCAGSGPSRSQFPARDLLEAISFESSLVATIAAAMLDRRTVSASDWTRLAAAVRRINAVRDLVYGR